MSIDWLVLLDPGQLLSGIARGIWLELDPYLINTISAKHMRYLVSFRTRNHRLQVETGRWRKLDLEERKCKLELKYRVEKISKIKRVEDELFLLIFFLRGL